MVHLNIIYWFNRSGVWIWNRFRVKFNWKLWRVNLNITIINEMIIKSPHDSWNNSNGFERRCTGFEVIFWMLAVTLSWRFIWCFTMKGVELIYLSSKTWWEKFSATDDSGIIFVSNTSTEFANTLLSHLCSCKNWMERWCIIVDGRWRTAMMRDLTWSGQCCWRSNKI